MSEKRILLASLLKPVNDTRMYEKLGRSLSTLPNVQVHIAGFAAPIPSDLPAGITLHPVFNFGRLSIGRIQAQATYWRLLNKVRPDLIVVCTHELLLLSVLYKRKSNCRLIYDIQENYRLNLLSQQHYPLGIRQILAGGVSVFERVTATSVDHFLLAERSYVEELPFLSNKYTILENKFAPGREYTTPLTPVQVRRDRIKLLYTGTISVLNGVFEAVDLVQKLHEAHTGVTLTIMGYCASGDVLTRLKDVISDKTYITLVGGDRLVPHHQILEAIAGSDLGLLPYHLHESISNCIPTKLYEYTASGLPVLVQQNPLWDNLVKKYDAGLSLDYTTFNVNSLVHALLKNKFYRFGVPEEVFWESEEKKLLPLFRQFL